MENKILKSRPPFVSARTEILVPNFRHLGDVISNVIDAKHRSGHVRHLLRRLPDRRVPLPHDERVIRRDAISTLFNSEKPNADSARSLRVVFGREKSVLLHNHLPTHSLDILFDRILNSDAGIRADRFATPDRARLQRAEESEPFVVRTALEALHGRRPHRRHLRGTRFVAAGHGRLQVLQGREVRGQRRNNQGNSFCRQKSCEDQYLSQGQSKVIDLSHEIRYVLSIILFKCTMMKVQKYCFLVYDHCTISKKVNCLTS